MIIAHEDILVTCFYCKSPLCHGQGVDGESGCPGPGMKQHIEFHTTHELQQDLGCVVRRPDPVQFLECRTNNQVSLLREHG